MGQIEQQEIWTEHRREWHLLHIWWAPLRKHEHRCKALLGEEAMSKIELRKPHLVPPWQTTIQTSIADSKEEAIQKHDNYLDSGALAIYTDGSVINGKVGASAVTITPGDIRQAYLGKDTEATIFMAELQGIRMALDLVLETNRTAVIFTDSQAAIKTIGKLGIMGQQFLTEILRTWEQIKNNGQDVEIAWIPSHEGVEGNELADQKAKEATGWRIVRNRRGRTTQADTDNTARRLTDLKVPLTCLLRIISSHVYARWEKEWREESRGRDLYKLAETPFRGIVSLHAKLSRPLSSILTQMRTGKIGLRDYLLNIRVPQVEDDVCQCLKGRESTSHLLRACPIFKDLRRDILWQGEWTTDLKKMLSHKNYAPKAARFMLHTKLLGQFRSVETEA
ncbi:uncharacterized protein GIQ15_03649 [Arthroderma uncinatum]|uniref:uncharacterized protein n=2 Tax=Arthroderma uncinatum TaxID=74035 RepID=UPI00144A865D|nr:uncharacterized protein GIQ15_03649 [Arthroderma uncinatum]KAF3484325.1 hypothetical protein GIQ15_03649 [Arthroderma uncinatum]